MKNSGKIYISKKTVVQIKSYKEMSDGIISEVYKYSDGVKYSNYDQEMVTVTKDGQIKAAAGHKLGKTTITVSLDGKSSNFEIEVME